MDNYLLELEDKANEAEREALEVMFGKPIVITTVSFGHNFDVRTRFCKICGVSMRDFHLTRNVSFAGGCHVT